MPPAGGRSLAFDLAVAQRGSQDWEKVWSAGLADVERRWASGRSGGGAEARVEVYLRVNGGASVKAESFGSSSILL